MSRHLCPNERQRWRDSTSDADCGGVKHVKSIQDNWAAATTVLIAIIMPCSTKVLTRMDGAAATPRSGAHIFLRYISDNRSAPGSMKPLVAGREQKGKG